MPRDFSPVPRRGQTGVPSLDMLTDPFAYLDQLKGLQETAAASAPRTTKAKEPPKRVEPAQVPPATTPPAASTPNVPAPAPAASSTPAGIRDYATEMDMLRRSYEAERAQMAQASAMGMGPNQLQERRTHERFMNRMGQLQAMQRQEERRAAFKARARAGAEANAAERLRRQRGYEELRASSDVGAAKISDSIRASQAVNPVDAANQEYLKDLASTYTPPAPASKAPSVPLSVDLGTYGEPQAEPTQPVGEPSPTADYVPGLDSAIRMIRGMLQTTPAAQVSSLASAPAPAPAAAPATLPPNPYAADQALIRQERLAREAEAAAKAKRLEDMSAASARAAAVLADGRAAEQEARAGRAAASPVAPEPRPAAPASPPIPLATVPGTGVPNIANPMGAPGPIPGINMSGDPLEQRAYENVQRRLAPTPADMRDPNFSRAFYTEVQREFARLGGRSASEIIATPPVQEMPDRGILGTLIGPGGLMGAPAPDAMVAQLYEIANDPNATPDQRARAQAGIATAQMQGGLMDLAGAGFVTGKPASPTTRVPEIPRGTPAPLPREVTFETPGPIYGDPFGDFTVGPGSTYTRPLQGPSAAQIRRQRMDAAVPIRDSSTTVLTPEEAARMRLDMPYVPEGRFAPEEIALRGNTTGDLYRQVPRTTTTFTPEGVETGYTMPIEPIGSALRGGRAGGVRGRDVVSAGDYAQPAGPGSPEGRIEALKQRDLATDVRMKREAQVDRILESLSRFGVLPARESSPVSEAPAPAVAQPAPKAAEPAPAPKAAEPAPVPAAEATAPAPKAKSRQSTIEALKAYGTKVVEDTRALLAKDRKGTVTDSDVLAYLKGLVPGKAGTANPQ